MTRPPGNLVSRRRFGACQGVSGRVVAHQSGSGLPGLSQATSVQNVEATARGVTHHFLCCDRPAPERFIASDTSLNRDTGDTH